MSSSPTEDGCAKRCYALSFCVTANAIGRVRSTASRIAPDQLTEIRRQIGFAIGLE
ncbi:MAG TPA: hypothetical protein VGG57_16560 [Stellaceae bacterium]